MDQNPIQSNKPSLDSPVTKFPLAFICGSKLLLHGQLQRLSNKAFALPTMAAKLSSQSLLLSTTTTTIPQCSQTESRITSSLPFTLLPLSPSKSLHFSKFHHSSSQSFKLEPKFPVFCRASGTQSTTEVSDIELATKIGQDRLLKVVFSLCFCLCGFSFDGFFGA